MPIRIAIVGFGKIARDQHVPAIAADPALELVAVSSPRLGPDSPARGFRDHRELFETMAGEVDAVALATPPGVRHAIAAEALAAGLHVLLEKPPAATLGEIEDLERRAREAGLTLFAAWHSQHAAGVEAAARALAGQTVRRLKVEWFEDVRKWHPGQAWIWAPGGFGVFDPGINALSILTRILPVPLFVREALLSYPENRQAPIAARLDLAGEAGALRAKMDWRHSEGERWSIRVETEAGTIVELDSGGAELRLDGRLQPVSPLGEYPSLYRRFAELIGSGRSEVDREPLRIVADALLVGARETVEPFLD
ncbi:MAG TPA: Gfo/Idh/MocA family oxidoreductase [Allosphingosinicella sp.]